jgi:PAS domain S-box-containing protein
MDFPYAHTPYIWPILASVAFMAALGICAVRHRTVPGAVPFIILVGFSLLWVLADVLKLAATGDRTKIFWFQLRAALMLPTVSAALCFVLEYAGMGRWVTRRTVSVLAVVPFVYVLVIVTNDSHHLVWRQIWFDGYVRAEFGPGNWGAISYGYFIGLLHVMVLVWLFAHSPRHRWMAASLILAPFITRGAFFFNIANWNPVAPLNPMLIAVNLALLPYALAVFSFRMFGVVPVARDTVIERMADGMIVLDAESHIVDVNATVQSIFCTDRSEVVGRRVEEALHAYPDLIALVRDSGATQGEVFLGSAPARWYQISISPLMDRRGFQLGRLVSLHDVTEQKRAQAQLLDHQRTVAMLEERELLARDLHDGIGQMLAAAHLQVKSVSELLTRGDIALAGSYLHRLAEVTQQAKESVREYLLGIKARSSPGQSLFTILRQYLNQYDHNYGIHTELVVPPELEQKRIDSTVGVQLQPVIQEALTNVRKHSGASSARLIFAPSDNHIRVTVEDGGRGFDPEEISEKQGFGLRSMRGRVEAVGGRLEVNSAPGKGTQVIIQVPWRKEET